MRGRDARLVRRLSRNPPAAILPWHPGSGGGRVTVRGILSPRWANVLFSACPVVATVPAAERSARTQQVRHRPRERVSRNTRPLKIPADARHTAHDHVSQFQVRHLYLDKKSGATTNRPGLHAAPHYARDGDVIVVHTLDRLGACSYWASRAARRSPSIARPARMTCSRLTGVWLYLARVFM